jgi:hypothetical protein
MEAAHGKFVVWGRVENKYPSAPRAANEKRRVVLKKQPGAR